MKILIITDDRRADETFIQISRKMICKENTVGVYDIGRKSQTDIMARYGTQVEYVKDLTPAVIEYYQLAFCLYGILPRLTTRNIYLTSYLNASSDQESVFCGADFLFLTGEGSVEGSAYYLMNGDDIEDNVKQILQIIGDIKRQCMSNGTFPEIMRQDLKDGIISIDEELSMEQIKKNRMRHLIMKNRFADLFSRILDLEPYYAALTEAVDREFCDEKKAFEIIKDIENGSDEVLYGLLKENESAFLNIRDTEVICALQYICLESGHYDQVLNYHNDYISKNSFLYYAHGMASYYLLDYDNCKDCLEQYYSLAASETELPERIRKLYNNEMIRDVYEQAMIGVFDPLTVECEDAYFLIQSMNPHNREVFYDTLMAKIQETNDQQEYQACVKLVDAYRMIVKSVGRDRNYSVHMVFSSKKAASACWKLKKPIKALKYRLITDFYFWRGKAAIIRKKLKISRLKKSVKEVLKSVFNNRKRRKAKIWLCQCLNSLHIYRKDERRILSFKDKHLGERCFILGNGPSLQIEDLDRLMANGDICFASNKIYKVFNKTKWRPDYYACTDALLFKQNFYSILEKGDYPKFFSNMTMQKAIREKDNHYIITYGMKPIEKVKFNPLATYIYSGGTVTYVMINLAWLMGFREIYLIGCDHNYGGFQNVDTINVKANEETKTDYFVGNYVRAGEVLNVGDLGRSEQGYRIAKDYIESHGGKIYNATRGGMLEVFPRADLDEVLNRKNSR